MKATYPPRTDWLGHCERELLLGDLLVFSASKRAGDRERKGTR